jgi:hypothetical protein
MTIREIVEDWLNGHEDEYDGLTDGDECSCINGDLFPCGDCFAELNCRKEKM